MDELEPQAAVRASRGSRRSRRAVPWIMTAIGFTAVGAAGALLVVRLNTTPGAPTGVALSAPASTEAPAASASVPADDGDAETLIASDVLARAGFKTAAVGAADVGASVTVPGTVMPNAYREVKVTPIAGGIVTKVQAELGMHVRRGAPLAILFSAELADAQTRYLSMRAMLEADHKKLDRTQRLAEIGAASRQELEEVTAFHAGRETEVAAAGQRLLLLGLTHEQLDNLKEPGQVVSQVVVPAPIDGVVTGRSANPGQVFAMGQEMFVVTDLSTVWLVGDLYEQDFPTVRIGSAATVTATAYPGFVVRGRVSYIDPRVDPQTRTAKVRVEVPNTDGHLRLGMYVNMAFTGAGAKRQIVVPRTAVQSMGDQHVVFMPVAGEEGKFLRRKIRLGTATSDSYVVLEGLRAGDTVVTEGSFLLRAESARNSS
ncbi:MAG: efflux RND transporter periplasmic adaptor subunit [Candidatus Limnocylindria bacterium]